MTDATDIPEFDPDGSAWPDMRLFSWKGHVLDQRDGIGAVPNVEDVEYFGFVGFVRPSVFLSLSAKGLRPENPLVPVLRSGGRFSMGFLQLDLDGDVPKVVGHEGRHRMDALRRVVGDEPMPVAFFVLGARARNISVEAIASLNDGILAESTVRGGTPTMVVGPIFDLVVHLGKRLRTPTPEETRGFGI